MEKNSKKISVILVWLWLGVLFAGVSTAQAATLYFSPSSGSYPVGATFTLNVYISSADKSMNAVSGAVKFPSDKLEVTSVSKIGSVIALWVQEPTFSNSSGSVTFEGIVLNPGFTGSNGKALSITFKTKTLGAAPITFSSGSILANDGMGTNILSGLGKAEFTLTANQQEAPKTSPPASAPAPAPALTPRQPSPQPSAPQPAASEKKGPVPTPPAISSPTHPEPEKWYSKKDAAFNWLLPGGAKAVGLGISQSILSTPEIEYIPPIYTKKVTELADGIWYFSARFKNDGGWGEVGRFQIRIDTTPPKSFAINFLDGKITQSSNPRISVNPQDELSGITGIYEIKLDGSEGFSASGEVIQLPPLKPGQHTLVVRAFDKAGNATLTTDEFTVQSVAAPVIEFYSTGLSRDDLLLVRGTTHPSSTVTLWLQRKGNKAVSISLVSDAAGKFVYLSKEPPKPGIYQLWAGVQVKGIKSQTTVKKSFTVSSLKRRRAAIYLLPFMLIGGYFGFSRFRRRIVGKTCQVKDARAATDVFMSDVREQVRWFERVKHKRDLTLTEKRLMKKMKAHLNETDEKRETR